MSALLVGYARCSTDQRDLTAQRDALLSLGVETERIYVDHGLTGTNRERPGLREALAACRSGDTLVVTKLDPWPGPCPMRGRSPTCSPPGRSASRWAGRCTTPPILSPAAGRAAQTQPEAGSHLVSLVHSGAYSTAEVAELFGVGRSTVYRAIERGC